MNNIGFAATNTTAVTNNNTATQAATNLNALAASFTSNSTGSASSGFNTLILSLFIQIIQTLLKNMQDKPCCDQPTKPQNLSLSDAEQTKLADALSTGGNKVTILSVEDSDKSGKLSVGDKVKIQRQTGELDAQGKPIVENASIKLTQEQLNRYQTPNKPAENTLEFSPAEQNKLLEVISLGRKFINAPSLVNVLDKDNSGSLSVGDQINLKSFSGRNDEIIGEPIFNYSTEALTAEQFSNYQNLSKEDELLDVSSQEQGWLQTAFNSAFYGASGAPTVLGIVYDNDNSGDISVGDSIGVRQYVGEGAPQPAGPYQVSLRELNEYFFGQYNEAKNT